MRFIVTGQSALSQEHVELGIASTTARRRTGPKKWTRVARNVMAVLPAFAARLVAMVPRGPCPWTLEPGTLGPRARGGAAAAHASRVPACYIVRLFSQRPRII